MKMDYKFIEDQLQVIKKEILYNSKRKEKYEKLYTNYKAISDNDSEMDMSEELEDARFSIKYHDEKLEYNTKLQDVFLTARDCTSTK
tara:strand:- start:2560 stop:2820 length:261 start_codon:yes stop_codon:yes gene_type:complete